MSTCAATRPNFAASLDRTGAFTQVNRDHVRCALENVSLSEKLPHDSQRVSAAAGVTVFAQQREGIITFAH